MNFLVDFIFVSILENEVAQFNYEISSNNCLLILRKSIWNKVVHYQLSF